MGRQVLGMLVALLLIGVNGFAANGDLYVNGNVGIGTTSPLLPLSVIANTASAPIYLKSQSGNDAFSILPWTPSGTYLTTGVYYKNSGFIQDSPSQYNAMFWFGGTGALWYASNTGTPSWNLAGGVPLWNASGVLTGASSRTLKENFQPIDYQDLLLKIGRMDITRWNYKTEGARTTHIGPVSEDFRALFQVGDSDKSIALIDEGGIALAGVKGLLDQAAAQEKKINDLQHEIEELRAELKKLTTN